jgi:hypothetical protein
MIGNLNLPIAKGNAKTYIFTVNGATADPVSSLTRGISSTSWEKPKGINFIYGLLVAPGMGGGGGHSFGVGGTAGGGGGGGTPGTVIQFLQPAYLFPESVLITVGRGGRGGAAATAGTLPNNFATAIYYRQGLQGLNFSTATLAAYAYSTGWYGYAGSTLTSGRAGSAVAGGNGGVAVTGVAPAANQPGIGGFSNFITTTAAAAFAGSLTAGTNATYAGKFGGGAGGGGVNSSIAYTGGNVIAPSSSPNSIWNQNLSGGANTGEAGADGITIFQPTLFSLPGAGGGANLTGTGGRGGNGGIGCGGGGGGAGVTGGAGGNGGDGLVMLVCW